jgi:hypothetical protein
LSSSWLSPSSGEGPQRVGLKCGGTGHSGPRSGSCPDSTAATRLTATDSMSTKQIGIGDYSRRPSALQAAQPVRHLGVGWVGVDGGRQRAGVPGKSLCQEQVTGGPRSDLCQDWRTALAPMKTGTVQYGKLRKRPEFRLNLTGSFATDTLTAGSRSQSIVQKRLFALPKPSPKCVSLRHRS